MLKGKERSKAYNARIYQTVRTLILFRDDGECLNCKSVSFSNEAHHLNHDNQNNSPDNLVTLCKSCHAMVTRSKAVIKLPNQIQESLLHKNILKFFHKFSNNF
jgi:5-methylcytosine-specific restriction endonuclease McrA